MFGSQNEEIKKQISSNGIFYVFDLKDQKLLWDCKQVGKDEYEIVFPLFCLKFLELEQDFKCGKVNGKASFTGEELDILSEEYVPQLKDWKENFDIFSLFVYSVKELLGYLPQTNLKETHGLGLAVYHEINTPKREALDLFYVFGENSFKFTLSYEAYYEAKTSASFSYLTPYFDSFYLNKIEEDQGDLECEIKISKLPDFFSSLNLFLSQF